MKLKALVCSVYLDTRVGGRSIFSEMVFLQSYAEPMGLAAARMEVLALSWQMMPALAMDNVCCSITSWRTDLNKH